jgi:hypothetical protein
MTVGFITSFHMWNFQRKNWSKSEEPWTEKYTSLCNQLALVHPEDGGDTILRNVGSYKSHMVSFPRRW